MSSKNLQEFMENFSPKKNELAFSDFSKMVSDFYALPLVLQKSLMKILNLLESIRTVFFQKKEETRAFTFSTRDTCKMNNKWMI